MKLSEVEEKLGEIYNLASMSQSHVRVLLYGPPEPIKLTDKQKKAIKAKVKDDITKLVETGKKILEGLK